MNYTENDLQTIAQHTLKELASRSTNVLALHGDLGAGKTTLVSAIAKELGVHESIISPTFIVYRVYDVLHPEAKLPDVSSECLAHSCTRGMLRSTSYSSVARAVYQFDAVSNVVKLIVDSYRKFYYIRSLQNGNKTFCG
jgi:predicted ATPase